MLNHMFKTDTDHDLILYDALQYNWLWSFQPEYPKVKSLFVFSWGGMKPRRSPNKTVRPNPFSILMLAWVTNVSTSPDLYIEFSTEY